MEIERKWILKSVPDNLVIYGKFVTEAVWFYSGEYEIKIRSMFPIDAIQSGLQVDTYTMVIKGPGNLSREEVSLTLSKADFNTLLRIVNKEPIRKTVMLCKLGDRELMICDVDGQFVYAEIEFNSEEEALSYRFPYEDYVVLDATYLDEYKMKNIWNKKICNEI